MVKLSLISKSILAITFVCGCINVSQASNTHNYQDRIKQCGSNNNQLATISRCLDGVIDSVDRELKTWITNQEFNLEELSIKSGRSSALNMFKRSQSNFLRYREDNCRWQYLAQSPEKTAQIVYKKCYILMSVARINNLKLSSH